MLPRRFGVIVAVCVLAAAAAPHAAAADDRVLDRSGVAYRPFGGQLRFHPLLSFQELNGHMDAGRRVRAARLARALIRRADRQGSALVWRYRFSYQGHRAGWTSGMAQAVAAEALARAGYRRAAKRAFLAVENLLARPGGTLWIKLYSFDSLPVLNAQLQSALSLQRYAYITRDRRARVVASRLLASADVLFPQFETACWSRYSLAGREATPLYHRYVGELIMRVARRSRSWRPRAAHFFASQRRPVLSAGSGPRTLYPVPAEGFRDVGRFSFVLSKCAWVTLRVGRHRELRVWLPSGRQTITWRPRGVPGNYPVRLIATDTAGRKAWLRLPDLVVRRDNAAPSVAARARGSELRWQAYDRGATPWVKLALRYRSGGSRVVLPLGRRPLRGTEPLPTLPWRAHADLVVADSSGNAKIVPIGAVGPLGRVASRGALLGTQG